MPMMSAVRLADLVAADRFNVIVCAEIATARDKDDYEFWEAIDDEMNSEEFKENNLLGKALRDDSYIRHIKQVIGLIPQTCLKFPRHHAACQA